MIESQGNIEKPNFCGADISQPIDKQEPSEALLL